MKLMKILFGIKKYCYWNNLTISLSNKKFRPSMDNKIITYSTLWNLVDVDRKDHQLKDIAMLFLNAMNDWPTYNQTDITDFIRELKAYFGSPLAVEKIEAKTFNGQSAWQVEAGSSISALIEISTRLCNQSDFDKIIDSILNYYNDEFNQVDFIAELKYLTAAQGGRKTPANPGYRPQVKFEFTDMQTSGQQTFIDKEMVYPGDKVEAKIKILSPNYFAGCLTKGMPFEFREGATLIGTGKITYIVNDKLEVADL
jgi:hypothetical protein